MHRHRIDLVVAVAAVIVIGGLVALSVGARQRATAALRDASATSRAAAMEAWKRCRGAEVSVALVPKQELAGGLLQRGEGELARARFAESIEAYRQVVEICDQVAATIRARGEALAARQRAEEALARVHRHVVALGQGAAVETSAPSARGASEAFAAERFEQAAEGWRAVAREADEMRRDALAARTSRARRAIDEGQYGRALDDLTVLLDEDPDGPARALFDDAAPRRADWWLGAAQARIGEATEARTRARAWLSVCRATEALGTARFLECLRTVVAEARLEVGDPGASAEIFLEVARLRRSHGDRAGISEALRDASLAVTSLPGPSRTYVYVRMAALAWSAGDGELRGGFWRSAVGGLPQFPYVNGEGYFAEALFEVEAERDLAHALARVRKISEFNPQRPSSFCLIALAAAERHDEVRYRESSLAASEELARSRWASGDVRERCLASLVRAEVALGRLDVAVRRCASIAPGVIREDADAALAIARARAGEIDGALESVGRVTKPERRSQAYATIAAARARGNENATELYRWAIGLPDRLDRVAALAGVADGLAR